MKNLRRFLVIILLVIAGNSLFAQQTATITVNPKAAITITNTPRVCFDGTSATSANMTYSITNFASFGANTPNNYRLDWDPAANTAGLADVNTPFDNVGNLTPGATGTIVLDVLANTAAGTYTADLYLWNSAKNCYNTPKVITLIIDPLPTMTVGTNVTTPGSTIDLEYTATNGTTYTVKTKPESWSNSTTNGTITTNTLTTGFGIPVGEAAGTYNVVVTISNANCSKDVTFPVIVNPTVTPSNIVVDFNSSAHNESEAFTSTGSPDAYKIEFTAANGGSINADFANANPSLMTADGVGNGKWVTGGSPFNINIPASTPVGVYTVDIYDRKTVSSINYESAKNTFTITVRPTVSVTTTAVCAGDGTVAITVLGGADEYWNGAAWVTITGATIPVAALAATTAAGSPYNGTIKVRKTTASNLESSVVNYSVTVNAIPDAPSVTNNAQQVCTDNLLTVLTGHAFTGMVATSNLTGETFDWTAGVSNDITGEANYTGATLSQTLINTAHTQQTQSYSVKATKNSCQSSATVVTVLVNPAPQADITNVPTGACENGDVPIEVTLTYGSNSSWSFKYTVNSLPASPYSPGTTTGGNSVGSFIITNIASGSISLKIMSVIDGKLCTSTY